MGNNLSRRSFLKSSASGVDAHEGASVTAKTGSAPSEPVVAYVHNAERHEVTVLRGTKQTTYRDPKLVKRLLAAAPGDEA